MLGEADVGMRPRLRIVECERTNTQQAIVVQYVGNRLFVTVSVPVVTGIRVVCVSRSGQGAMLRPVCHGRSHASGQEDRQEGGCA